MKTELNFEDESTKKLLSKLDFEFFLKQNIEVEKYTENEINQIYECYKTTKIVLAKKSKENRKQFNFYVEGQARKMFTGGLLPALFELDEGRGHTIFDFPPIGENWAYFEHWQKYYKKKVTKEKVWDFIIKTGSLLAFLL